MSASSAKLRLPKALAVASGAQPVWNAGVNDEPLPRPTLFRDREQPHERVDLCAIADETNIVQAANQIQKEAPR